MHTCAHSQFHTLIALQYMQRKWLCIHVHRCIGTAIWQPHPILVIAIGLDGVEYLEHAVHVALYKQLTVMLACLLPPIAHSMQKYEGAAAVASPLSLDIRLTGPGEKRAAHASSANTVARGHTCDEGFRAWLLGRSARAAMNVGGSMPKMWTYPREKRHELAVKCALINWSFLTYIAAVLQSWILSRAACWCHLSIS